MTTPRSGPGQGQSDQISGQNLQPNPDEVNNFHRYSDVDVSPESQHHTLGMDPNQTSQGDHTHDGKNSKTLYAGTITGSRGGNVALASLLSALNAKGIIIDSTVI